MTGADGSVYGFRVHSTVPLRFLRQGGGLESLTIVPGPADARRPGTGHLVDWPLVGREVAVQASLYQTSSGYEFWTTDTGRFAIDLSGGRIEVPVDAADSLLREQRLYGVPMILSLLARGDFSIHAAAVEVEGGALLLAAPSRHGKTTLALAFHERGHRLLSEDLACIRPVDATLAAGPAVVRLRPDVYRGAPPRGLELVAERPDRVFLAPPLAARGGSAPLPIRALCFLREGETVEVKPLRPVEALSDLWHLNFRLPFAENRGEAFRQLSALASAVPIWNLARPLRLDALQETIDTILERLDS